MSRKLTILSLNVGLSHNLAGLSTLLSVNAADLILLQEIRISKEQLLAALGGPGFKAVVNIDEDSPLSPGTAVVWKETLPVEDVISLVLCRLQVVIIGDYLVLNVYAPSGSSKKHERSLFFSEDVFPAFSLFPNFFYILSGDFNCVLNPIDIENGIGFNHKFCASLKDLAFSYKLVDPFRAKYPRKEEFTFFRPGKAASRLDRFYIPSSYSAYTSISHVASLSDHCATILQFQINNLSFPSLKKAGRSTYWKLNTSILKDDDFNSSFSSFWSEKSKFFLPGIFCPERIHKLVAKS